MNSDCTGLTNLSNNAATEDVLAFSSDGLMIVFDSTRDGNVEIYNMNPDGSDRTNLTNSLPVDSDPVFPSGSNGRVSVYDTTDTSLLGAGPGGGSSLPG